jgi:dicarboxylate transporter 10
VLISTDTVPTHSPLDLTKVRLQASGDKHMIESIKKTYRTAGARGLFDGISGTWLHQMSYSMCRFWAYDESKKFLGARKDVPAWKFALVGSMGMCSHRLG